MFFGQGQSSSKRFLHWFVLRACSEQSFFRFSLTHFHKIADLVHVCLSCPVISIWLFSQNDFPKTLQSVKKYEAEVNRSLENLLKQETDVKVCSPIPYYLGDGLCL